MFSTLVYIKTIETVRFEELWPIVHNNGKTQLRASETPFSTNLVTRRLVKTHNKVCFLTKKKNSVVWTDTEKVKSVGVRNAAFF